MGKVPPGHLSQRDEEGMMASLQGLAALCIYFRRFWRNALILVPSPSLLSGSVSRVAAGPAGRGVFSPLPGLQLFLA